MMRNQPHDRCGQIDDILLWLMVFVRFKCVRPPSQVIHCQPKRNKPAEELGPRGEVGPSREIQGPGPRRVALRGNQRLDQSVPSQANRNEDPEVSPRTHCSSFTGSAAGRGV